MTIERERLGESGVMGGESGVIGREISDIPTPISLSERWEERGIRGEKENVVRHNRLCEVCYLAYLWLFRVI